MVLTDGTKEKYLPVCSDLLDKGVWVFMLIFLCFPKVANQEGHFSTTMYERTDFEQLLTEHHHLSVYCLCTPKEFVWCEKLLWSVDFSLSRLFYSFSRYNLNPESNS